MSITCEWVLVDRYENNVRTKTILENELPSIDEVAIHFDGNYRVRHICNGNMNTFIIIATDT
jgi:hypothetical protein